MADQSFLPEDLPLFPRRDPGHFLVRLRVERDDAAYNTGENSGGAGRLVWASGDLDAAEREGRVDILQRPLKEGVELDAWRAERRAANIKERLRQAGLAGPEEGDGESADDWAADKGLLRDVRLPKRLF